jgi:nucleoside-diphosphate-sugar epimerase
VSLPRIIITGSSGFVGRHLLEAFKDEFTIYAMARRSQARCGAPVHPNIKWYQVDIGERDHLSSVFRSIREEGGVDLLIHLAAHYDFTGENDPEYHRTNVQGLRNVLDLSRGLGLHRFVFSSSVAACAFPEPGQALNEDSPPDGDHIYAHTKAIGERMLKEYEDDFPSCTIRFAAMFSDWCEYPPLFMFFRTWLSNAWNNRMLGGKGRSAIPYLHVRDAVGFFDALLYRLDDVAPGEILIASPDGAVSHLDLFENSVYFYRGRHAKPIFMPKALAIPGMHARCLAGRFTGELPFERPWMGRYIDLSLTVNAARTRGRLGWTPKPRLEIVRRLPFMLDNLRMHPLEWNRRNRQAMEAVKFRPNLKVHWLLEKHEEEISDQFTKVLTGPRAKDLFPSYQRLPSDQHRWNHRLVLRQLMNSVRTRDRAVFYTYCRDVAIRRYEDGFTAKEISRALVELDHICTRVLLEDPESEDIREFLPDYINMTIQFGCDRVQETFESLWERDSRARARGNVDDYGRPRTRK